MNYQRKIFEWLDRFLTSRTIPVESFGWRQMGQWHPDNGTPVSFGRWEWPEAEREPFHRHNRELLAMAIWCRKMAR